MSANTPAGFAVRDEREVLGVLESVYTAWGANDADAFAALYVEDATVVMPGVFNQGKEAVRSYMAAAFAGPLKGSRGIEDPKSVRFIGDDAAVVVSEAGILMAGESELPDERLRRATWVLTKRDGRWFVAAYHNCAAH